MKKLISVILTAVMLISSAGVFALPHDNFEYAEFTNNGHVQKTSGGFIVTKDDGAAVYYDKFGNETDDITAAAGSNIFYIESENVPVNEYDPETGSGHSYTIKYYYIYDNNNNLIERLPSDEYSITEYGDYIVTANYDDNIENVTIKFYSKTTGELVSELNAAEYLIGNTNSENPSIDLAYFNLSKSGYFVFTALNGLCGIADIYGNIILEPEYESLSMFDYDNDYFTARIDGSLCVIDIKGNTIKETSYKTLYKFADDNGKNYYGASDDSYTNYLLDENFEEIKMPDRMEFMGFLDDEKTLVKVMRPIVERPSTYDTNEAVIDLSGNVIIPFEKNLSNINMLGDNLISAHMLENYYHFTLFDRSGNTIAENCTEITEAGDNGYVGIHMNEESFYVDQSGKTVLYPPEGYTVQGVFSEGLASVVKTDTIVYGNYGETAYIDENGKIVIEGDKNWCRGYEFENGIAPVGLNLGKAGPTNVTYIKFTGKVPSDWAEDMVNEAEENGILTAGEVYYKDDISREEFCNLAYNTLDAAMDAEWEIPSANPFSDTENEKVLVLAALGIIEGKGDGLFAPNDSLTREEAATIVLRLAEYAGIKADVAEDTAYDVDTGIKADTDDIDIKTDTADDFSYADDADISEWAKDAVYKLRQLGIMQGTDIGFEPQAHYTFEQSVVTLMRLYNLIDASPDAPDVEIPATGEPDTFADKFNAKMPDDKNYMFSPVSVKMALAMAANGAEDGSETEKEILDALSIDDLQSYNEAAKEMIEKYSASDLLKINIANSIWINTDNTDQKFSKEYEELISDIFGATSDTVTNDTAVSKINGWVDDKTEGKIPSIIDEESTDFWAMLINAVYFKGRWLNEFNKNATKEDTFTDKNGDESKIDFMNAADWYNYSQDGGVSIIELPYLSTESSRGENGEYTVNNLDLDISMYLMMSDGGFNPEETLNKTELSRQYIALSMPKFKIEYSAKLNEILKNIGINKAFEENAEFDKMFDSGNMWITDTIHKTYIDVDEEGTEAAAVTAIGMGGASLPPEPMEVKFNKPFTFVIRDNTNGEILFMGEYAFAE